MAAPDDRRIRVLVISGGGERQETLQALFNSDKWDLHFSPGVPSRSLRPRYGCLQALGRVGLLPPEEWAALQNTLTPDSGKTASWDALDQVPLADGRTEHYAVEFWNKSRTINRGKSVLGCLLAHLIAMKRFVEEDFDILLEDNVRWTQDTVDQLQELRSQNDDRGDMLYYGWLGSRPNISWVYSHFFTSQHRNYVPFPLTQDIERTVGLVDSPDKPGGTPVWGLYAYWISKAGYEAVMETLRKDIGALFWKSKRMRCYSTKPADKIVPRALMKHNLSVKIVTKPLFFRAPMLLSRIHPHWDPLFCESTTLQLSLSGRSWGDVHLLPSESKIIEHYQETGEWIRSTECEDHPKV